MTLVPKTVIRLLHRFQTWPKRQRLGHALSRMSDHRLRDIGIERDDIPKFIREAYPEAFRAEDTRDARHDCGQAMAPTGSRCRAASDPLSRGVLGRMIASII